MSCYFIAQIKIIDDKEYQKYLEQASGIFKKYNGKYLSVDNNPLVLEGHWDYTRTVLIEFGSTEDFNNWYKSDDYQNILKHRLNAAICDSVLIRGLD
jgi:uncharacterized protein (DUF1330 family)